VTFRFSLESLLRLRRSIEERERAALLAIVEEIARARSDLGAVERHQAEQAKNRWASLNEGATGSDLHLATICENAAEQLRALLAARIEKLRTTEEQRRREWLDARREREILDKVREQQYAAYCIEAARREQAAADDLYLLRRSVPARR